MRRIGLAVVLAISLLVPLVGGAQPAGRLVRLGRLSLAALPEHVPRPRLQCPRCGASEGM